MFHVIKVTSGGGLRDGSKSLCDIGLIACLGRGTATGGIEDS